MCTYKYIILYMYINQVSLLTNTVLYLSLTRLLIEHKLELLAHLLIKQT